MLSTPFVNRLTSNGFQSALAVRIITMDRDDCQEAPSSIDLNLNHCCAAAANSRIASHYWGSNPADGA
jgi:hypothetical protein